MKLEVPYLNKKQRLAIILLVVMIVVLQGVLFMARKHTGSFAKHVKRADAEVLKELDSLKKLALKKTVMQPFNPNYISDAKGFRLGMSVEEIDRLLKFRNAGNYVNSARDFQKVTGISDELLAKLEPFFKFPEWTKTPKHDREETVRNRVDLNSAGFDELIGIRGVGDYTARIILDERERLGGFISVQQLDFVKGLRPEILHALKKGVVVKKPVLIKKTNINTATKEELAKVPYIGNYLAREILIFRSKQDEPIKIEDLEKINNFPLDKLNIIKLYLDF